MNTSTARRTSAITIGLLMLAVAGCGGDDDPDAEATSTTEASTTSSEAAAPSTEVPATTLPDSTTSTTDATTTTTDATTTTTEAAPETTEPDDDLIIVEDMADMPDECVDLLRDFLVLVEPIVSEIDWTTASLADLEQLLTDNEDEFATYTDNTEAAGCDQFDFDSSQRSLEAMLELAEDVAPGTIPWLETLSTFDTDDPGAQGPTECEDALAFMDELLPQYPKIADVPIGQINSMSTALDTINEDCSAEQAEAFFARDDIINFIS